MSQKKTRSNFFTNSWLKTNKGEFGSRSKKVLDNFFLNVEELTAPKKKGYIKSFFAKIR